MRVLECGLASVQTKGAVEVNEIFRQNRSRVSDYHETWRVITPGPWVRHEQFGSETILQCE